VANSNTPATVIVGKYHLSCIDIYISFKFRLGCVYAFFIANPVPSELKVRNLGFHLIGQYFSDEVCRREAEQTRAA
jgi:hypothetical protein